VAAARTSPTEDGPRADARMFLLLHHALRSDLDRLVAALDAIPDDDRRRARGLARWYRKLARQIHGHHRAEDEVFFPRLATRSEELVAGAGREMADDHRYLAALTARVADRLQRLARNGEAWSEARGAARADAAALASLAHDHFAHEERVVVPLFARHFSAAEYETLRREADRVHPPSELCFALPWFFDHLETAEREVILAETSVPLRLLAAVLRPRYRQLVRAAGLPTNENLR
jgi:hemerythrin-like domain-containing protein